MRHFWMKDQWWLVLYANLAAYGTRELGKIQFRTTSGRGLFDPRFLTLFCKALGNDFCHFMGYSSEPRKG
jgi:hypothetical protein